MTASGREAVFRHWLHSAQLCPRSTGFRIAKRLN